MTKVVINRCWRGPLLNEAGLVEFARRVGEDIPLDKIARDEPALVAMMEENEALWRGPCAEPKIVEVPDDADWVIRNFGKKEWIALNA